MSIKNLVPYFWIAFYTDGSILPQYEITDGKRHLFKEIDQTKLAKFGWFPFNSELAKKANKTGETEQYYHRPNLPPIIMTINPNQRLIALRREHQSTFTYAHCMNCNFNWQPMPNREDGSIGDSGLPRFGSEKYFMVRDKKLVGFICPKCGSYNEPECQSCKKPWNKVDESGTLKCPKCNKLQRKFIQFLAAHTIGAIFLLGWQETIEGKNHKMIMFIDNNGTITMSDDYNFM